MPKIKRNAPLTAAEKSERKEWPFKDMNVNDAVDYRAKDEYKAAAEYALTFGARREPQWKFKTKWHNEGFGRIRRVA